MREVPPITYIQTVMIKPLQKTLHKGYNWLFSLDLTTSKTKTFTDNSNAMSKNVIYITMKKEMTTFFVMEKLLDIVTFLVGAFCRKMCLTIKTSSVFSSDREIYANATTYNIHSNSYEETLAKHFTQRLQLVN